MTGLKIDYKIYDAPQNGGASRIVRGWATRPEEDRDGDIVIPRGARYQLPLPFLLDHKTDRAIGSVDEVFVGDDGIRFVASVRDIGGDSDVARACDNAWKLLQNGLRGHVSIGFRALAYEPRENRGYIIKEWEWLELSAVTIPANPGAEITALKNYGGAVAGGTVKLLNARAILPPGTFRLVSSIA